jgi:hypothetical protein
MLLGGWAMTIVVVVLVLGVLVSVTVYLRFDFRYSGSRQTFGAMTVWLQKK